MKLHLTLTLTFLSVLFCACSGVDPEETRLYPWAEATFAEPREATIRITNGGSAARDLGFDLRRYHENLGKELPDSLTPGATAFVTVRTHHPRYFYLGAGNYHQHHLLLPGRSRHLILEDSTAREMGEFAAEYDYLDGVLQPLNPARRQAPKIENLQDFYTAESEKVRRHLDTVFPPAGLPAYVDPLMRRIARLHPYEDVLSMQHYYKLFYKDTMELSSALVIALDSLVRQPVTYQTPQYEMMQQGLAARHVRLDWDPAESFKSNRAAAMLAGLLNGFPLPERQHDAMADYAAQQIGNSYVFSGKMEIIDTLRKSLPEAYRRRLDTIERRAIELAASPNGLAEFIKTEFEDPNGEIKSVAGLTTKPLRLLKFWFAGCYPCILQQPHEEKIIANYPDVDLVYVAHSTDPGQWQPYLDRHRPPTDLQLYVPLKKRALIEAAAGTTGAPTYVMISAAGETICRPCPKPEDPLLGKMIAEALAGSSDR